MASMGPWSRMPAADAITEEELLALANPKVSSKIPPLVAAPAASAKIPALVAAPSRVAPKAEAKAKPKKAAPSVAMEAPKASAPASQIAMPALPPRPEFEMPSFRVGSDDPEAQFQMNQAAAMDASKIDPMSKFRRVERGSGLTSKNENATAAETSGQLKKDLFLETPEWESILGDTARQHEFQNTAQGIDNQSQMIEGEAKRPLQLDLSPLAGLVDTWTGSKLQAGYKRPESGEERNHRILAYHQKLQDDKQQLNKMLLDSVATRKAGSTMDAFELGRKSMSGTGAYDPRRDDMRPTGGGGQGKGFDDKALERFQKQMKPNDEIMTQIEIVENDIKSAMGIDDLDKWDGKKDIPGWGATRRGWRVLLSPHGKQIQQSADALEKLYSNLTGGLALTATEATLAKKALGQTLSSDDKVALKGLADFKRVIQGRMRQVQSGYKSDIPAEYKKNGSRLAKDFVVPKGGWVTEGTKGGNDARAAEKEALRKQLEELKKQ